MPTVEAGFPVSPLIQNPFIPFQMIRDQILLFGIMTLSQPLKL